MKIESQWYREIKSESSAEEKKKSNGGNGQISQLTNLPKKRRTAKFLLESASAETVARG